MGVIEGPESDGTLKWQETTIVLARVGAGGQTGIGSRTQTTVCAAALRRSVALQRKHKREFCE